MSRTIAPIVQTKMKLVIQLREGYNVLLTSFKGKREVKTND